MAQMMHSLYIVPFGPHRLQYSVVTYCSLAQTVRIGAQAL